MHIERSKHHVRVFAASAGAMVLAVASLPGLASAADEPVAQVSVKPDVAMRYHWSIQNTASKSSLGTVPGGSKLAAEYTVVATPGDYEYTRAVIAGEVSITNPSSTDELSVDVTVEGSDAAWACQAAAPKATVQAGESATFAYDCVLSGDAEPHEQGSIDAAIAWSGAGGEGTVKSSTPYQLNPTQTNRDVTVESVFNGGAPAKLGTAQWTMEGKSVTFRDAREFTAADKPGNYTVTHQARIGKSGTQAAVAVTYTVEAPSPTPEPTPEESSPSPSPSQPSSPSPSETPSESPEAPSPSPSASQPPNPTTPKPTQSHSDGHRRPSPGMPPTGVGQ